MQLGDKTNDVDNGELHDVVMANWGAIKTFAPCHGLQVMINISMWNSEDDSFKTDLSDKALKV